MEDELLEDEIKKKEAEILVTLQDIAKEVMATTEVSETPVKAADEDDSQVDSDLSKVANEIALTTGSLLESNSETDIDDDIVDDAVEIKDTPRPDLSYLWEPKVTEICVEEKVVDPKESVLKAVEIKKVQADLSYLWAPKVKEVVPVHNKIEPENKVQENEPDASPPKLEDEFVAEETIKDELTPEKDTMKTEDPKKNSFQYTFEQSVLDATDNPPLALEEELSSTNKDSENDRGEMELEALEAQRDGKIETIVQNGNNANNETEESEVDDNTETETEEPPNTSKVEIEDNSITDEKDDSCSWKIDFIRVETETKTPSKSKKVPVKNEKWNVSKGKKEKVNKRKKDKRKERKREQQAVHKLVPESVEMAAIVIDMRQAPQKRSRKEKESKDERRRTVKRVEDWAKVVDLGQAWEQETLRSLVLKDTMEAYSPVVPRGTSSR